MAYVTAEARQELLDTVAEATDEIAKALAALGAAYEELDEASGDVLEELLFRPVQGAYGKARRTHTEFAQRVGLPTRSFTQPQARTGDARQQVEDALEAATHADDILSELQDSMSPVEVGDAELRAGLAEVRRALGEVPGATQRLMRSLGRWRAT